MAPLSVFVTLVTVMPSTIACAFCAAWIGVSPLPDGGYTRPANPSSPSVCVIVIAFAAPIVRAAIVSRASPEPVITVACTLVPAADELIAAAMPARVLFVESMTTSKFCPPVVMCNVPRPTGVVAFAYAPGADCSLCAAASCSTSIE